MGSFITNILKINARQLLNKKTKRTKTATSFVSRSHYGSSSSIHSSAMTIGRNTPISRLAHNPHGDLQVSSSNINNNSSHSHKRFSPAPNSLLITSPLAYQPQNRYKNSSKLQNSVDHTTANSRNGQSPEPVTKTTLSNYKNIDLYFNGNEEDQKKLPSININLFANGISPYLFKKAFRLLNF